jgi:FixJ family two-component response regulator
MVEVRPRLAVVDDDADVRVALSRLIGAAGFEAQPYDSGSEFLRSIGDSPPDCVVLDLHMPQPDGFEVLRQLAARHPRVTAVVITGHDSSESRRRALDLGAAGYLCKPVEADELLRAVGEAMHR